MVDVLFDDMIENVDDVEGNDEIFEGSKNIFGRISGFGKKLENSSEF